MAYIEFNCLPTIIGSLPHTDPDAACEFVARHLRDIPAWPQLPRRSFRENMYAQYAEGFPGAVIRDDKLFIDRAQDLDGALERLYAAYLANDIQTFPISPGHAAGLYEFLKLTYILPKAVKGQVTGPVSWGLTVTDNDGRSIIYDDTLSDAAARLLRLKAAWQ
ncbi:MAG: methionine synthase, partial [Chloroflexi bacterium]|nr:methionine synthase [Chloroflexota bacterium]